MRITPMDIEQQEFSRSFRGYNEEEVDDFLDKIVKDYEELINENIRLNEEIEKIQEKLKEFGEIEESLRSALLNTQKSSEEMKGRIEKEAKVIIEKAEMEAKALKQQVFQREDLVKTEIDNLRRYKFTFKEKFKSMLNLYLKMIENEDFEKEENYEFKENEMSKEKTKNKISGERTEKLEGLDIEKDYKIEETEDEQRY
ncbi:MAG: DivIVA domain-containing protein [Candidatus Atribacteria bacterium]|nr:DivIVA domain-containing protein [Candidatus Atribacteria bacterium]